MGAKTGIEWTDATWNPILGCSRVSEGCRNCYAERIAGRFPNSSVYGGLTQIVNGRAVWTGQIKETKKLLEPLSWKSSKRVFVNSMSDLFHENVSDELRDRIFAVMALCPQHTFQVLTKRPENMLRYITRGVGGIVRRDFVNAWFHHLNPTHRNDQHVSQWPLPNVWLGVSVETQKAADERIPLLLQTPAVVRFISAEPLLGMVTLREVQYDRTVEIDTLTGDHGVIRPLRGRSHRKLDWVICGGESGPGARPMHPDWARSLRDQCRAAGVPFFFKQWGEWLPAGEDGGKTEKLGQVLNASDKPWRVGKKAAGALLDGREWKQFPEAR